MHSIATRLAGLLVAGLLLAGGDLAQAGIRVVDDLGRPVTLDRPAQRIVSLAPDITELVFAAGAGQHLVGVSEFSDYPAAARTVRRIGGGTGLDLEAIVGLDPDLVIAWRSGSPARDWQRLAQLGLAVFVSEPRRLADIPGSLRRIGRLAGTGSVAERAAGAFRNRHEGLRARYRDHVPVRVFYQVWDRPLMTVNGAHMISDVIRLCGGVNVFADLPELAPQLATEAVLAADPEAIVVAGDGEGEGELAAWRNWPEVNAVAAGALFAIDRDLLVRSAPRILEGAERLCRALDAVRAQQHGRGAR